MCFSCSCVHVCVCVTASWYSSWEKIRWKTALSVSLYLPVISPVVRPEEQSLNNRESVCCRGMLYLSSPEDCGKDKDLHVSACLSPLLCGYGDWWGRGGGGGVGVDPASTIRNTTQSGESCAKHALGPAVTLFNTRVKYVPFAFSAFAYCNTECGRVLRGAARFCGLNTHTL